MGKKKKQVPRQMFSEANKKTFGNSDVTQNVLYLQGDIELEKIADISCAIMADNLSDPDERPDVINLIITSRGGDMDAAFALINVMRGSAIPIRTIGTGTVGSAALCIFMAGDHRVVTPFTSLLSHQFSSSGVEGNYNDLGVMYSEMQRYYTKMCELYKECTGRTIKDIEKNLLKHEDVWLTPEESVEYNIADDVLSMN